MEPWYIPHASKKLHKTTIAVCKRNNNVRMADTSRVDVDERQDECRQRKSRQTKRSWVGEFPVRRPVQTGLKFTTKGGQAQLRVVGRNVGKRVAAIVIRCPLLGSATIRCVVEGAGTVVILLETRAALRIL